MTISTHERLDGGQERRRIAKPLEEFPLYVLGRLGAADAALYAAPRFDAAHDARPARLFSSAGDADNTYTLYEDDGLSRDYERGIHATTELNYRRAGRCDDRHRPSRRRQPYWGRSRAAPTGSSCPPPGSSAAKANGRTVKPVFDGQLGCPVVEVPSTDIRKEVKIEIFGCGPEPVPGRRFACPPRTWNRFFCKFVSKPSSR